MVTGLNGYSLAMGDGHDIGENSVMRFAKSDAA